MARPSGACTVVQGLYRRHQRASRRKAAASPSGSAPSTMTDGQMARASASGMPIRNPSRSAAAVAAVIRKPCRDAVTWARTASSGRHLPRSVACRLCHRRRSIDHWGSQTETKRLMIPLNQPTVRLASLATHEIGLPAGGADARHGKSAASQRCARSRRNRPSRDSSSGRIGAGMMTDQQSRCSGCCSTQRQPATGREIVGRVV